MNSVHVRKKWRSKPISRRGVRLLYTGRNGGDAERDGGLHEDRRL